ncbi:MAG: SGNH/GDSL hydrolase family protein [Gammaproteobacteria bacterium]|nr:SGNH/GDSL hydrolase family protein [Gammaproteobacteria bacterium]
MIAATVTLSACDAVNKAIDAVDDINSDADVYYYVSLGTSLSVGVQPNGSGITLPTDDGYADQLFDSIRPAFEAAGAQPRELRLVKLGCPGETLDDFANGVSCLYIAGSQLAAAVDFLNDNAGKIHLLTIDIGGNDFRNADCIGATVDLDCANAVSAQIATDLDVVLAALRNAAGPDTTIVGMNYYNPYLSSWLEDAAGQTRATQSADAVRILTDTLDTTYASAGIAVADVAAAFQSDDFTTIVPTPNGQLPLSVANICDFTYQCDPDPVGPDIHANTAGYSLIAEAFAAQLP